jgi:O-antigen/teichoic acid export membrane protein
LFAVATAFVSLLSALAKALIAHQLPASSFGSYSFAMSFLLLGASIFEFGFFAPAARLAARAKERHEVGRIVAASLLIYIPIGLAFSAAVYASSFVVDSWSHTSSGDALRVVAPLAFVFPFAEISLWLAQGMDRLHIYSLVSGFARLLFVASLLALFYFEDRPSLTPILLLQALSMLVGAVVFVLWVRPLFRGSRHYIESLIRDSKRFGFQIYLGRVLSLGTYNMDVLMVAAWASARQVGLYALAGALAGTIGLPVLGMANALYPRMARASALRRHWVAAAWVIGLTLAFVVWSFAEPFIRVVFSADYLTATRYLVPLLLAQVVRSVTRVYNNFLAAHGLGKEMRNAGLILAGSNIALNFALIPKYGAMGAAWASLVALLANYLAYVYYYRRGVNTLRLAELRP